MINGEEACPCGTCIHGRSHEISRLGPLIRSHGKLKGGKVGRREEKRGEERRREEKRGIGRGGVTLGIRASEGKGNVKK